ncbi:hypothetical protein JCM3774_001675 [Rhodotorula dairenensis]
MSSPVSANSSDWEGSSTPSTAPTTAPPSPKLRVRGARLPAPFYPPSLARTEGLRADTVADPLPAEYPPLPSTSTLPSEADAQTKGTPDQWIPRDERLVRLTGKWPFNSEPALPDLWQGGFLTPPSLHYVRNHGNVPQVSLAEAAEWSIEVSGLVERPCTLSLADLLDPLKFETVTLPVTLVCAGNRRKEQNVVAKSLGFSWGPAGLSTALWTGVYLADVLAYVRPKAEGVVGLPGYRRPEHVIFEGAEDLPHGKYGTSQRLRWARQKEKGMLLAWAMNGEALEPDHGFPLRLIVPGQIGGRSVKWLKKIVIDSQESQHHLHFHDNKVLPGTLTAEQARDQKDWWYDPRYIINDLNVNAAVARPAHDEKVVCTADARATYPVEGYVYAGGGRRVTRVEVTLDDGASWQLCDISYPEDAYRTRAFEGRVWGRIDLTERDECFCWAMWRIELPVADLKASKCLAVRGMDESLAQMGKSMYWNPTGMMNNWWFRVAIHASIDVTGAEILTFEHPTMPGLQPGGWMERIKENGQDPANPSFLVPDSATEAAAVRGSSAKPAALVMTKPGVDRQITMDEVRAHNQPLEPWFVVHGQVYDGTGFLKAHPGGAESITLVAGEDATEDFMAIHSVDAKLRLADFHIGTLVPEEASLPGPTSVPSEPDPTFLSKTRWKPAELVSIERVNHDSRVYRFALEHGNQPLGLPIGQHVYARLRRKVTAAGTAGEGELVQRAYTPVSRQGAKGYLDLLIKVYFRTGAYPDGGKMTLGFEELQVGDSIEFKGPLGSFEWLGRGRCTWRGEERAVSRVGMVCAGSGITPILQVLRGIVLDEQDQSTKVHVLNANRTEADILMRAELNDLLTQAGPDRVRQHLVLSQPPDAGWQYSRGRITRDHLVEHLPPPGDDALVLMCAPPALQDAVSAQLAELGWDVSRQVVVF